MSARTQRSRPAAGSRQRRRDAREHGVERGRALGGLELALQPLDALGEALVGHGLQDVVDGIAVEGFDRVLVVGRHEHHMRARIDAPGELEAGEPRHADVEERHLGLLLVDPAQRLDAVGGERQHFELGPELGQARAQVLGEVRFVVGDEGARAHPGSLTVTTAPAGRFSPMASEARSP